MIIKVIGDLKMNVKLNFNKFDDLKDKYQYHKKAIDLFTECPINNKLKWGLVIASSKTSSDTSGSIQQ